jgi:hypothetical protein
MVDVDSLWYEEPGNVPMKAIIPPRKKLDNSQERIG